MADVLQKVSVGKRMQHGRSKEQQAVSRIKLGESPVVVSQEQRIVQEKEVLPLSLYTQKYYINYMYIHRFIFT